MNVHLLRISPVVLVLALAVHADTAAAQTQGACCAQSTSKLDALLNPVSGGDEKFFTATSTGIPNVVFSIDNSGSMRWWPFELCPTETVSGCTCSAMNNLGYDNNTTYFPELENLNSSSYNSRYFEKWFENDRFYEVRPKPDNSDWTTNWYGNPSSNEPGGARSETTATNVCSGSTDPAACAVCLNPTTGKGYYLDRGNHLKSVMQGNFLNFFSPRYLMARRVVKQVIEEIRPIRLVLHTYNPDKPKLLKDVNPRCGMPPSSFDSNRNSFINAIDDLEIAGGTPLTRALVGAGQQYDNKDNSRYTAAWGTKWYERLGWSSPRIEEKDTGNHRGVCDACQFNAIILLTDGEPNDCGEKLNCYTGTDTTVPQINVGADIVVPGCGATCTDSKLDEVARWLWNTDLRPELPGRQSAATFTVAFALEPSSDGYKLLQSTAAVGGGDFFSAKNGVELKQALLNAFEAINNRATAFSSSNIASLQTGDVTLAAVIPRMKPQKNGPWSGLLYRFNQYNEFILDTEHPDDNDPPDASGYKNDIFLVDTGNKIVQEDPLSGDFVHKTSPSTPATPFWEANKELVERGHQNRNIRTVIDSDNDGLFSAADTQLAFTKENVEQLLPYMGLAEPGLCPSSETGQAGRILSTLSPTQDDYRDVCGGSFADGGVATLFGADGGLTISQSEATLCCAKMVIEWTRGRELVGLLQDGGSTTRSEVLGDIFHSSPVTADPPVNRFLCDLGVSNQCVRTIYSTDLGGTASTPLASATVSNDCGSVPNANAYDQYLRENHRRQKLVLVGANDGMLHAFNAGTATGIATSAGSTVCSGGWPTVKYNEGDGKEVWAFIPPDQLPRIHERIFGHTYYVDGDIMIRDIWADANNNGQKEASEFHTVAITAEGRGGTHYFALGLNWDTAQTDPSAQNPTFRWLYPQPCTPEAQLFGKTLYSLSPKPPPIGPVLLGGDVTVSGSPATAQLSTSTSNTVQRYGAATREHWMVVLSGGWSPFLDKGRGLYMVDAWHAKVNTRPDNLWWKVEYDPTATGADAPRAAMTHSFAAPVALVDYGQDFNPRLDGFFDLALAGDTAGQLWLARLAAPGTLTGGLIGNWPIARVFEQDRDNYGAVTLPATNPLELAYSGNAKVTRNVNPFFYLPSTALQSDTSSLRAFIGSGNRYSLLDDKAGTCRYDNPLACSKYTGCTAARQIGFDGRPKQVISQLENHWANVSGVPYFGHTVQTLSSASADVCGSGAPVVNAGHTAREITCTGASTPTNDPPVPASLGLVHVQCGKNGVDAGFFCGVVDGGTMYNEDYIIPDAGLAADIGRNRFYGMRAYGPGRYLAMTADAGTLDPATFDALRYTDRAGDGGLTDVTNVNCSRSSCNGGAEHNGNGWFFEYSSLHRKTASGSVVLAGCVLWSDIYPVPNSDGGCTSAVRAQSELIQADFITGAPNCAFGFLNEDGGYSRLLQRDVLAPPPEPAMAIMVGPNQQIKYSALLVEPGKNQATAVDVTSGTDILQSVYELPVSRDLHNCRHGDAGCF